MKRLLLHIGTPKTGTTAIQYFLQQNRDTLAKQGISFPLLPRKCSRDIPLNRNAHFLLALALDRVKPEKHPEDYLRFAKENWKAFESVVRENDTVLLSDESYWSRYASCLDLWDAVQQLCSEAGFDSVDIYAYLRRQDDYALSLWNQTIKSGKRKTMTIEEYLQTQYAAQILDYDAGIRRLEAAFGREHVHLRVYSRNALHNGDSRVDFCSFVGIEPSDEFVFTDTTENTRIKADNLVEIKRQANFAQSYLQTDNFLNNSSKVESSRTEGTTLLPYDLRMRLLAKHAEGNARIAREYFGREDGQLFDPPTGVSKDWEYDSQTFAYDTVRFFADAIAREHADRVKAEKLLKAALEQQRRHEKQTARLEQDLAHMEERLECLERQSRSSSTSPNIIARICHKIWFLRAQLAPSASRVRYAFLPTEDSGESRPGSANP
ncbi:MAG TPA: hypothetical protein DCP91_00215 [Eggerthellaceae bacterium]|nr:hypothetical protein [Eggerthellaceae bacterium]